MEFEVYKEKLRVKADSLELKELQELYDMDKSASKDVATSVLLYIFFREERSDKNPLRDIIYSQRDMEAKLRAFGDKDYNINKELGQSWIKAIQSGITAYKTEIVTDAQRDLDTFDKKMDQFGLMLSTETPKIVRNESDMDNKVSFSTNIDIINKVLRDIVDIIQAKASLIALHTLGKAPKHLRGKLSPRVKGKIKGKL